MSRTLRWWNNSNIKKVSKRIRAFINSNINPFYWKHELKFIRVKLHRQFRHMNRQNIKKGLDYEKEPKTNGWMTH